MLPAGALPAVGRAALVGLRAQVGKGHLGGLAEKIGRKKLDITAAAITTAMMSAIIYSFSAPGYPPFGEARHILMDGTPPAAGRAVRNARRRRPDAAAGVAVPIRIHGLCHCLVGLLIGEQPGGQRKMAFSPCSGQFHVPAATASGRSVSRRSTSTGFPPAPGLPPADRPSRSSPGRPWPSGCASRPRKRLDEMNALVTGEIPPRSLPHYRRQMHGVDHLHFRKRFQQRAAARS
jgi:hypothetical protein